MNDKKLVRAYVRIYGIVQGVFFRANTRRVAKRLGLTGYVRNMSDGSVEAVFEGEGDKVRQAIEWCRHGPPLARVERVDVRYEPYRGEYDDFYILY
ncbi:MAG: acylphosphatase [Thermoprotei archaeon]|nr:MAG: acylphosphatase [Thermoprotei archaeon]